jgi:hypothetical protein
MRMALGAGLIVILQASTAFADDLACFSTTLRVIGSPCDLHQIDQPPLRVARRLEVALRRVEAGVAEYVRATPCSRLRSRASIRAKFGPKLKLSLMV